MNILVTGAAGFIGSHTAERLQELGHHVIGVDNFNDYYSLELKQLDGNGFATYTTTTKEPFQVYLMTPKLHFKKD